MEVNSQLRQELKEVLEKRKELVEKLRKLDFSIRVFQKEISLRNSFKRKN